MFPAWDTDLFRFINEAHQPWLDKPMEIISGKLTWIPLYALLIYYLYKQLKQAVWKAIIYLLTTILFADQISSSLLKPLFKRLRPCHVEEFQSWIHLPDGCGGMYGLCSSHAANAFAVAVGFYLLSKNKRMGAALLIWASVISYSRIYLGAHYPLDVITGAIVGAAGAWLLFTFYLRFTKNS
jgi:undecaprenyl-diphosphatase